MQSLPTHYFVINLRHRPERYAEFQNKIQAYPFANLIQRFEAISGDVCNPPVNWIAGNGAWGCYKSHLNILESCLNNRVGSYCVFEDDAQFKPNFLEVFEKTFNELPEDWDQVYFGGQLLHTNSRPPIKVSQNVYRVYNVNRTHCFAVSRKGMQKIYQHISNLPFHPREHIDHHLGRWHEDNESKVYAPPFWVVGQHGSSSSVSGKHEPVAFYDDPIKFVKDHWLFKKPCCVLFQGQPHLIQRLLSDLHFGNQISSQGFDVTLDEASKYTYPLPKVAEWYNWVRSECVQENGYRIPAAYHPFLSQEILERAGAGKILLVTPSDTYDSILEKLNDFKQTAM